MLELLRVPTVGSLIGCSSHMRIIAGVNNESSVDFSSQIRFVSHAKDKWLSAASLGSRRQSSVVCDTGLSRMKQTLSLCAYHK